MNTKLLGSSLIIAGTALGAGMLAIPMVLAQFGLTNGILLMLFICVGTTYSALLLLEATVKSGGGLGLNSIARKTLGKGGQWSTNALLYALLICLLMAYILGAGDLVVQLMSTMGLKVTQHQAQVGFTLLSGCIIAGGTGVIDKLNRGLFTVMVLSLLITLVFLLPNVESNHLTAVISHDYTALIQTSAVLFTSFGSMVVIPSLVAYNPTATDSQLRNMVIWGSMIPLVCYVSWLIAVAGNLAPEQLGQLDGVGGLIEAFKHHSSWIGSLLTVFTGLALLTSFFGVAMALYNQNRDMFNKNKPTTYVMTFSIPLIGALFAADKFLAVLGYAGIILVFLAVFIPLSMVYKLRLANEEPERYTAEGGSLMLLLTMVFGGFLLVSQVI
jgi:tyrosine-specific transport protein